MSSLPDGVTSRSLHREDAALVANMLVEYERSFGHEPSIGEQDVHAWWVRTNLEEDSWLLEDAGTAVAGGWLERQDDHAFAGAAVRPEAMGRGLGSWLVDRAEDHARSLGFKLLRQGTMAVDAAACELLEARGYREARRHWEMAIEMEEEPPAPEQPDGLAVETFSEEDAREFHDAIGEAFADEWGFSPLPFDEWWAMRKDDDKSLWFVIRDGERIAAYARCESGRHGGGYVGMIGTRRAWRRRGLGLALLQHAFGELYGRGIRRVTLGVDSENASGATRLYERAGMHVESEHVSFEKELA
jgi:ribosomal protein S18 acetylase RimI-like enzyme